MRDRHPPKRHRSSIDQSLLSEEDQLAFARVASLLQKPVSELYDDNLHGNISGTFSEEIDASRNDSCDWSAHHWETTDVWLPGRTEANNVTFGPNQQWAPALDITETGNTPGVDFTQWTNNVNHGSTQTDLGCGGIYPGPRRSSSWSHEPTTAEPWISLPTSFLPEASFQQATTAHSEDISFPTSNSIYHSTETSHASGAEPKFTESQVNLLGTVQGQFALSSSSSGQSIAHSNETELLSALEWERVDKPQFPDIQSSPPASDSGWSLIASNKAQNRITRNPANNRDTDSIHWVSVDSNGGKALQKAVRRGPFLDPQLREETSNTRKLKACVRCRMQKIRCLIDANNPTGICQTCKDVSTQRVHTLPCVRHKLTDCVIYRTGKAKGLEFTFRWPEMKLKDITEWSSNHIRTIKVQSDLCDTPLELTVRKFVPIPQDTLRKSWMDGKKKKFKDTTPFAIVNMNDAVKVMGDYINKHIFECVAYWLKDKDEWVQETYAFARKYMLVAPPDEQALLSDTFRLWFAIRRTATTEFIVGNDTLDMEPEIKDRSYPLFGKVPLPPVMIQQLDMILTLGFLKPLRKKFLEDFQRLTMSNNPRSWMAIYLITFIACHSCAAVTAEHTRMPENMD